MNLLTQLECVLYGGVVVWVGTVVVIVACFAAAARCDEPADDEDTDRPALFTEEHLATFERMRAAIETADRQTAPGLASADLIDCFWIWPEAGEDGTS